MRIIHTEEICQTSRVKTYRGVFLLGSQEQLEQSISNKTAKCIAGRVWQQFKG